MESRWNQDKAKAIANDRLALRVYTSRLIGSDPSLVLHGGGNTSVKDDVTDLFGTTHRILFVKGSGWDLATIEKPGFAPVRMDTLEQMANLDTLSDSDMVKHQRAAMIDPTAPNPSVEAILHAVIPHVFVDHTHADAVVTLTNTPDGEKRIRDLFGERMMIFPYLMPGFVLAKGVYEGTKNIDWETLDGIVLLNHGLFTFHEDPRESYEQHMRIVTQAENALAKTQVAVASGTGSAAMPNLELARLRQAVSQLRGAPVLAQPNSSPEAVGFAKREDVADLGNRGLLTPDHVIRTKRLPLICQGDLADDLQQYEADYQAYFDRNVEPGLTRLDAAPRWAICPGHGTVALGRNVKECGIVGDINRHTVRAMQRAEDLSRWEVLDEKSVFDVEYWELEQAKLRKGGAPPELLGKIAAVSGAASGIGRACVDALLARGATVAALDLDPAVTQSWERPDVLGIQVDLTDPVGRRAAIASCVATYGGLDGLVLNAGMLPSSQKIESIDLASWEKSLQVNLTSHQQLLKEAIPFLKLGWQPGVVVVASKNVPAPGPGAGAYSVAKAGLTQLARVAALELGPDGIRVNVLHPNAVFDTAIWTAEVLQSRADHYGMSVAEYKKNNLLQVDVRSRDVADLAVAMIGPLFSRTTGSQVPVDGGNDRVI